MREASENVNCPYCLSEIKSGEDTVRCPKCGVVHHLECWRANGKCSVYGCDGWVIWSSQITNKVAPAVEDKIEIETGPQRASKSEEPVRCIKCGTPVRPGQVTCWNCSKKHRFMFFENCLGPMVVVFCAAAGTIALIVKAFV